MPCSLNLDLTAQVRKKQKEPRVDTELVYAYAKVNQLEQLQEFISGTHQANLQVG